MDPKTNLPHPRTRLEAALSDLKHLRIHPDVNVETQAKNVLKRLRDVLPIKPNALEATVFVPHALLGKTQGMLHSVSKISNEKYNDQGCTMRISFVAGDLEKIIGLINKVGENGDIHFELESGDDAHKTSTTSGKGKNIFGGAQSKGGRRKKIKKSKKKKG